MRSPRNRSQARLLGVGLLLSSVALGGCLPGDERPEPASLFVTAEPNAATASGFTTPDGWTVTFDRFVTSVGQTRLSQDSCNPYGEPHYSWLIDFAVAEQEKISLIYALGTCALEFDFRPPDRDSPLGPGATEQDRSLMRVRGTDAYADNQYVALLVQGSASRGSSSKRFDWRFRHRYELKRCPALSGNGFVSELDFEGGDALTRRIVVRGEELFRQAAIDGSPLQFDAFADADADGDGRLTFEELGAVEAPLDDGLGPEDGGTGGGPAQADGTSLSLADLVYRHLLGRIMYVDGGGTCEAELEN